MLSLINRDRCNFYVVTSNAFGANRFLKQKQRNVSCPLGGEIFVSVFVSASPLLLPPPAPFLSLFCLSFCFPFSRSRGCYDFREFQRNYGHGQPGIALTSIFLLAPTVRDFQNFGEKLRAITRIKNLSDVSLG